MKLSVVTQLRAHDEGVIKQAFELLQNQTIDANEFELLIFYNYENVSLEMVRFVEKLKESCKLNIVLKEGKIDVEGLRGEYITFFDFYTKFRPNVYERLYNAAQKRNLDFISACLEEKNEKKIINKKNIMQSNFATITALKIIKKEVLLTKEFNFISQLNESNIKYLDIKLYLSGSNYDFATDIKYKNKTPFNEEYIINSIKDIQYIFDSSISDYGEGFNQDLKIILFKQILNLVDKNTFLNEVEKGHQETLLNVLKDLLSISDERIYKGNEGYKEFLNLITLGLYDEAMKYMVIFRSKRYWYNQSQKYETYFEKNPYLLEESLSWKIAKPIRGIQRIFGYIKNSLYKVLILLLSLFIKMRFAGKEIWLVGEREDQAEDNGFFFFKYCREKYPSERIYYVINEDSPHLDKVEQYGNVIYHSSFKHKVYMLAASTYISAWVFEECSYPRPKQQFIKWFGNIVSKKNHICLQHGVIIHNIAPYLSKERYKQDLIISSSEYEKRIIMKTLGYPDKDVAVTGLARFDNLHERKTKKQILIMPTWRRHLLNVNKAQFLQSDYYKVYKSLIDNKDFLNLIEKKNIEVKFYIHSQMQKFMDEFVVNHPKIEFLVKNNATVSELLKESALLITDYSSVSSDFLYMEKPVIMYQFDPHNNHHAPCEEIRYSDLGYIVSKEQALIKQINKVMEDNLKISKRYLANSKRIFKYKDTKNAERIYKVIKEKTS
ncbi:CDP-glycerol glycerophosphotransferase family protein [Bacillus mobilis]|uniref:CDP-glycerol glycerophosphotransferase family protein n=1 Tax=Bacillus mobilis TaxID=2026190 RepID=UPI002E23C76E|nr:CDP-glycerol glycerophosphotransferase family protein [Bacillus mobilis]MED1001080.1 CDP-glycerol glycerophosphotransferase family protein [Bacillus mobilis]